MKKQFLAILAVTLFFLVCIGQANAEVKIGVLAKNGATKAMKKWGAMGEYLTSKIGEPVTIVPLAFQEVNPAIASGSVDFFLVNSSMFMTAKVKYGAVPVVTMINSRQGSALSSFGGVIFTGSDNNRVNSLSDLKGKKFGGVKRSSFGGWQMAQKEFAEAGIDIYPFVSVLRFFDEHDNVVKAVLAKQVDAGTVRTDTLERMTANGAISMSDIKIIAQKNPKGFPFVVSTALYPEWPLAKTSNTKSQLAQRVAAALKSLSADNKAAKNAKIIGWSDPLDYSVVENLQRDLKVGGFK